ncbi:MAG: integrin alpha [Pseudomonadota bacterium]
MKTLRLPRYTQAAWFTYGLAGVAASAVAGTFPAEVDLELLREESGADGSVGFNLISSPSEGFSRLGRYLANVGDVNDDGIADFAISDAGVNKVYVVFGRDSGFPATFSVDALDPANGGDGSSGFLLADADRLRVAPAGDVDNDGIADLMWSSITASEVYVLYGSAAPFPASISGDDLRAANGGDGSLGSVLSAVGEDIRLGDNIASAGDTNNDGADDLVLRAGASGDCNFQVTFCAGEFFLVYGATDGFGAEFDLSVLRGGDGTLGRSIIGPERTDVNAPADAVVAGIGDHNGDGFDDVLFGAPQAVQMPTGRAYVLFGNDDDDGDLVLSDLLAENGGDGSDGFAINPEGEADLSRIAGAGAGDVNGDGLTDFVLGATLAAPDGVTQAGSAYLLLGRNDTFAAEVNLADLRLGSDLGSVLETGEAFDGTGFAVGAGGDLNADGMDDLIVAANRDGAAAPGSVFVLYGDDAGFAAVIDLSELLASNGGDGARGTVFQATSADAFDEVQATGVGDINGDGIDDLLIGANQARGTDEGFDDNGEGYVIFGRLPAALNAQIIGVNLSLGACRNVSSGETVSVGLPDFALDESFDCTALALQFAPGDQVLLQGEGTNFGTALNGIVVGLAPGANVTCRDEMTSEEVTVELSDDGLFDCEAAGFARPNQTPVTVIIRGSAEELFPTPARIALTLDGMDTRSTLCQNLTVPQTVTGTLPEVRLSETIDCDALGLSAQAGDLVTVQGRGRNFGAGLSGTIESLVDDLVVRCDNTSLGETQFIALEAGESTFDCAAAGLTLRNQDAVSVTVRGVVDESL